MTDILIWSKNRATQLELCLRSIKAKFKPAHKIIVQYTYDNNEYKKAYDIVSKKYPNVIFIKEDDFRNTLVKLINTFENEYCMFFTDDDVFVKPVSVKEYEFLMGVYKSNQNIHVLSFRMNMSINFCNPANTAIERPSSFIESEEYLLWNWQQPGINRHYCWGYPMAINSHLYPRERIVDQIKRSDFHNVNSLESRLNGKRWFDKPLILSFNETKVFNVQNNFVQGSRMKEEHFNQSIKMLNDKFLQGYRLSTKNLYGMNPQRAHGAIEYQFIKNK